jgi:hypothetical protein
VNKLKGVMMMLTFAFDCQLNNNEDYIKEGTKVRVYNHPLKKQGFTAVVIEAAFNHKGKEITFPSTYEWFSNAAFKELN